MTTKKKVPDLTERINPDLIYRTSNPIAKAVIGLGPTQTWEAVRRGELPPPIALTDSGSARGWTGAQLLDLQKKRVEKAEAEAARLARTKGDAGG